MNLKPLADRIVVKPQKALEKTSGGIYLPETVSKEKPNRGEVVAVGLGKLDKKGARMPLEAKIGDVVYYSAWAGTEIKIEDEPYLIMREEDLLALEEKN